MEPCPDRERSLHRLPVAGACRAESVYVVEVCLQTATEGLVDLLDDRERRRASAFVFTRHRNGFVGAHAALRLLLAHCLGVSPTEVRFAFSSQGKPSIDHDVDLRFNLSHSESRAVIALTMGRAVGIDIE